MATLKILLKVSLVIWHTVLSCHSHYISNKYLFNNKLNRKNAGSSWESRIRFNKIKLLEKE